MSVPSTHASLLLDLCGESQPDETWAVFCARYSGVILGWCERRGLPRPDAEDLTQDVLLKLYQKLPAYRHDSARGQFRGWLKAVVNNALTDYWRRRPEFSAVGGSAFQLRLAELATPEAAVDLSTTLERHARTTAADVVERVRSKLKDTTWQAFYQTLVEGRPAAEVAADLNLSIASVYKATYRVKKLLLQECPDACDLGGGPAAVSAPDGPGTAPA